MDEENFDLGDGRKLTIDKDALAHHVREGNIPAEIAALWLKPGYLQEAFKKRFDEKSWPDSLP